MTLTFDLSVPKTRVSDPLSNVTVPSLKSANTNRLAVHKYRQIYIETVVIAAAATEFQYGVTDACFFCYSNFIFSHLRCLSHFLMNVRFSCWPNSFLHLVAVCVHLALNVHASIIQEICLKTPSMHLPAVCAFAVA